MPIPSNGVIYVQSVPTEHHRTRTTRTADARGPARRARPGDSPSARVASSDDRIYRRHPLGYPQANDVTTYGCLSGDVFLRGQLSGQLTIAADNNVYVVGNTTYAGGTGGTDILGLIANNYIEVYHPVRTDSSSNWGTTCDGGGNGSYTGCSLKIPVDQYREADLVVHTGLPQPADPVGAAHAAALVPGAELPVRNDERGQPLRDGRDRPEVPRHRDADRHVRATARPTRTTSV